MDSHSESAQKRPLEPSTGKISQRQNFILYIPVLSRTAGSKSRVRDPDPSTPPLLAASKSPAADARTLFPLTQGQAYVLSRGWKGYQQPSSLGPPVRESGKRSRLATGVSRADKRREEAKRDGDGARDGLEGCVEIRQLHRDLPLTFIESSLYTWGGQRERDIKRCCGLLELQRLQFY